MRLRFFASVFLLFSAIYAQAAPRPVKPYPLHTWKNISCRSKGRFQDRTYCGSPVIDRIVADGKAATPVLIGQITDRRLIQEPVYDFWPRIRAGELAYFILDNLFLDETWQHRTMPELFPQMKCDQPGWVCWAEFRKRHSLQAMQARWMKFWRENQEKIYWDERGRCFRLKA